MSAIGPRVLALLDYDRSVTGSFSGDDADQWSKGFDLGGVFTHVAIECPALDASATVGIAKMENSEAEDPDEVPVLVEFQKYDNTSATWARTAATTQTNRICVMTGPMQFGRIKCSANQAANRSFYVQGFNP